ncbi:MAG: hypothetical protein HKN20_10695 [Gemmatimonadetes bacterium]|nr:hypothetical protein [Gemmatimonadota bacterium]
MTLRKKIILPLLTASLLIAGVWATAPEPAGASQAGAPVAANEYDVQRLSLEEGVSHNLVFDIVQDHTGFIWFGTMYGLVRYDGDQYRFYRHDPGDSLSLSNDDIVTIHVDRIGDLWLGTYGGGVNHFDRARNAFVRYLPDAGNPNALHDGIVWDIEEDGDGRIWVGTEAGGLARIDPTSRTVHTYRANADDPLSLPHDHVGALSVGEGGRLYVGTAAGLCAYDETKDSFVRIDSIPGIDPAVLALPVNALVTDDDGTTWLGTLGGGIIGIRGTGGIGGGHELRAHYRHDAGDPASLVFDWVTTLAVVDSRIWAGTFRGMAALREDGSFDRYLNVPGDDHSLRSNYVVAIEQDRSGVVWVGSYQGGAHKLRPRGSLVRHVRGTGGESDMPIARVTSIREAAPGVAAVGTKSGLFFWNRAQNTIRPLEASQLPAPSVRSLAQDHDRRLWVGTSAGLAVLRPETAPANASTGAQSDAAPGPFTCTTERTFLNAPGDSTSLPHDQINALLVDHTGTVWAGTGGGGLARYDTDSHSFTSFRHDPNDPHSIAGNYVQSAFEDAQGRIWASSYQGLSRLDADRARFTHFSADPADPASISSNYVYVMHEDESGRLWFGTGNGLNLYDEATGAFRHFREDAGLPNNVVAGIAPSSNGRFWLSTNRGLAEFDPERGAVVRTVDASQGAQSNLFSEGAYATLEGGQLAFGGVNGFNVFHPDSVLLHDQPPEVAVTSFWDQRGARAPVDVVSPSPVRLPHDRNQVAIGFSAFDFHAPEKTQFEYRLLGKRADGNDGSGWTLAGSERYAPYTNLAPGEYTFEVRARNAGGEWSAQPARLSLTIDPPFWRTAWFAMLATLAIGGTLFLTHTLRVRRKLAVAEAIQSARLEEAEIVRKKAAADFHDELGHRLAKIALFSEVIKNRMTNASVDIRDYLQKIIRESHTLSNDTRDFIWSLGSEEKTLRDLAAYLRDFGNELYDRTDIRFRFEGWDEDLDRILLPIDVRRHTTAIFKEGMTNALKHASCSEVTLRIRVIGDLYEISLRDDGVGYTRPNEDDGNGLKNMENRARKIQGEIQFKSEPGSGSRIQLVRRSE